MVSGILLLTIAWLVFHLWTDNHIVQTLNPPAIVHEIQQLAELTTVKYTVQKVVAIEKREVPLGSEKLLLFVQAEVLAGVDLSALSTRDVRLPKRGEIQVSLPTPKIVSIAMDENQTKVWDRRITWWTPWVAPDPDLERQARLEARTEIEQSALQMGILDQARRNAEMTIKSLLMTLGAKSVAITS
jgi:hypothetical protein